MKNNEPRASLQRRGLTVNEKQQSLGALRDASAALRTLQIELRDAPAFSTALERLVVEYRLLAAAIVSAPVFEDDPE